MLARGADNVAIIADQISKGAVVTGQISFQYKGTIRPYYMMVRANMSQIHTYFSTHFNVGTWYAAADVYKAVEELKIRNTIKIEIYDEAHEVTTKYNVQQILDTILKAILADVFQSDPKVQAEKQSAQAQKGERYWWWSGGFAFRGSSSTYTNIFNFELKIGGLSGPIPVSVGLKLDTPRRVDIGCNKRIYDTLEESFALEAMAANSLPEELLAARRSDDRTSEEGS